LAWLAAAGILVLFALALTWVAVIPGLTAKSAEGASAFSYPPTHAPVHTRREITSAHRHSRRRNVRCAISQKMISHTVCRPRCVSWRINCP
jgi:hypothetical protein